MFLMSDSVKILCQREHSQNSIISKKHASDRLSLTMFETPQINKLTNPSRKNSDIGFEHNRLNLC